MERFITTTKKKRSRWNGNERGENNNKRHVNKTWDIRFVFMCLINRALEEEQKKTNRCLRARACTHVYVRVRVHVCVRARVRVCVCGCMCEYACTHALFE